MTHIEEVLREVEKAVRQLGKAKVEAQVERGKVRG